MFCMLLIFNIRHSYRYLPFDFEAFSCSDHVTYQIWVEKHEKFQIQRHGSNNLSVEVRIFKIWRLRTLHDSPPLKSDITLNWVEQGVDAILYSINYGETGTSKG